MVVHAQPEEDDEHEQRQPGDHATVSREAQQRAEVPALEDPGEHAVGGADREQVEQDRHQRDAPGAESDAQQDEGQCEDEDEDRDGPAVELVGEVVRHRRLAADRVLDALHGAEGRGQHGAPQLFQGLVRPVVGALTDERDAHDHHVTDLDRGDRLGDPAAGGGRLLVQGIDRRPQSGGVGTRTVVGGDRDTGGARGTREGVIHPDRGVHRGDTTRQAVGRSRVLKLHA